MKLIELSELKKELKEKKEFEFHLEYDNCYHTVNKCKKDFPCPGKYLLICEDEQFEIYCEAIKEGRKIFLKPYYGEEFEDFCW